MTQQKFEAAAQLLSQICSIEAAMAAVEEEKNGYSEMKIGTRTCGFYLAEFKQDFIDFLGDEKEKFENDFKKM
ncbi:MAG: hypothetical protein E7300_00925 [Lachnospiraceae bacterium]|nr:hypothetical protein [Lachnospiraceae bacterium]